MTTKRGDGGAGVRRALLAAALLLALAAGARADGCYFPERAFQALPQIPSQRALLTFRDGQEELLLESVVDGPGQSFGWIIPLPAVPTRLEPRQPGLLATLSVALQPRITHDLTSLVLGLLSLSLPITAWLLSGLARGAGRMGTWRGGMDVLVVTVLLVVVAGMLLPTLSKAGRAPVGAIGGGGGAVPGVTVLSTATVGSYETVALQAHTPVALDIWLEANGFRTLPAAANSIVSDYIAQGWRFVAVRLRREGDGAARPHPLALTFATSHPIYPMRLTALAGGPVHLELFVVAAERASHPKLKLECADVYRYVRRVNWLPTEWLGDSQRDVAGIVGERHWQRVYHPAVADEVPQGAVVSKLCGILRPDDMKNDLVLHFGGAAPYRRHLFSWQGAWQTSLVAALGVYIVFLPLGVWLRVRRWRGEFTRRRLLRGTLAPILGAAALVALLLFCCLPKTQVRTQRGKYDVTLESFYYRKVYVSPRPGLPLAVLSADTIGTELARLCDEAGVRNVYTGEPLRPERSPGNFVVVRWQEHWCVVTIGHDGAPQRSMPWPDSE